MEWLYVSLGVVAFLFVNVAVAVFIGYRKTFYRQERKKHIDPKTGLGAEGYKEHAAACERVVDKLSAMSYENVYITSRDGLKLHARYYGVRDGAPVAIMCHGYKSASLRDFSGGALLVMELGMNALLIDQRAHEESEGNVITFGEKERYDCLDWVNYTVSRFGEEVKIMLCGLSMGAATVILSTALDLPKNVLGTFADCPFSSARGVIKGTIRNMGINESLIYPAVRLGGKIFGKTDPERVDVAGAAALHKVPIMLVHGDGDNFVPYRMSVEIYEKMKDDPRCSFHTFSSAEHGMSFMCETQRYCDLLRKFAIDIGVISEDSPEISAERIFQ